VFILPPPDLPMPVLTRDPAPDRAALMQVGPNPSPRGAAPLPIPRRRAPADAPIATPARQPAKLSLCLAAAKVDPIAGLAAARAWLVQSVKADDRVAAQQCLGLILAGQGDFAEAESAFAASLADIPNGAPGAKVPMLALAGSSALHTGSAERALGWFDQALGFKDDADPAMLGTVQADRARALVALGRLGEAGTALEEAHRLAPDHAEGWLLSATLARRGPNGSPDLAKAQNDIEIAARLDPRDPAIGLEAGLIAVLAGRDEPARRSWESVIRLAPESDEAKAAQNYLDQLGPQPASPSSAAEKRP
jgi:tetratricopeptide (TPR) repeat protein